MTGDVVCTGRKKRNGQIEFLRFLFCIIIVCRHGTIFYPEAITKYFQRGALGVEFFFLVSGFLMAYSAAKFQPWVEKRDCGKITVDFLKRKIKALCPELPISFLIAFLVSIVSRGNFSIKGLIIAANKWIWEVLLISMAGFSREMHMGIWYISAMLLAMLILFPLCCRYFDMFVRVIAPIIALSLIGGIALSTQTTLGPTHIIDGIVYKGMVRGIGEVALGAACYPLIEYLKNIRLSSLSKYLVDISTFLCVILSAVWMIFGEGRNYDLVCLLLITILICLSFSHQGMASPVFDNKFFYGLGKLSLPIYLSHDEWAKAIKIYYDGLLEKGLAGQSPFQEWVFMNLIYIALIILTVWLICVISKLYRRRREKILIVLKRIFLVDNS